MAKIFYEKDADLKILKGKKIAIIGYGSQGHAQAQNLRDSGLDVIVSEVQNSPNYQLALEHGFSPVGAGEAAKQAHIIQILVPDEAQADLYKDAIAPHLSEGKTLVFSHGFNIHFAQIIPPQNVDVIMVAPKAPGHLLRREYTKGEGVPCLVAVYQDFTGNAMETVLAYAKAIGSTRAGALETTFKEETETDLFGEQTVLCGGISSLIKSGFETLVDAGYQPEVAYFECLHEMKLIVDLMYEGGISYMWYSVSDTAEYGGLTRGDRIIDERIRQEMKEILTAIQNGEFAREYILENKANRPHFTLLRKREKGHLIEKVGAELRKMMSWLQKK